MIDLDDKRELVDVLNQLDRELEHEAALQADVALLMTLYNRVIGVKS